MSLKNSQSSLRVLASGAVMRTEEAGIRACCNKHSRPSLECIVYCGEQRLLKQPDSSAGFAAAPRSCRARRSRDPSVARSGPSSLAVDPAGSAAARWRRRHATGMMRRAPAALPGLGSHGKEARPRRQAGVETARVSRRRLVVCANQEAERDATGRTPHETRACQARACLSRIDLLSQLQNSPQFLP